MRINKLLSNFGVCSRKDANRLIADGRIKVNGVLCIPGQWVELEDEVFIDEQPIKQLEKIYIALNKPVGVTCTAAKEVKGNIIEYMNYPQYIFPVGRLDKESQGLIILTNDGELASKIIEADNHHEKEYIVSVDKPLSSEFLWGISQGVEILGGRTRHCEVNLVDDFTFRIILTQGLNRQIRRMTRVFGYTVTRLKRIRILSIELKGIEEGKWRYLTENELKSLKSNN